MPMVVVGNKSDLIRKLPFEEIEATVTLDWEAGYAECSAIDKNTDNVVTIMKELYSQHFRIMGVGDKGNDEVFEVETKKPIQVLKKLLSSDNFDMIKRKSSSDVLKSETCKIS